MKNSSKDYKSMFISYLLLGALFLTIGIGNLFALLYPDFSDGFEIYGVNLIMGIIFPVPGVALMAYGVRCQKMINIAKEEEKQEEIRKAEETRKRKLPVFYQKCVDAGCTNISIPHMKEKIRLFAENEGLTYPNGIEKLWEEAKVLYEQKQQKDKAQKLDELRAKERKERFRLDQYSSLQGREKRVRILTKARDELSAAISATEELSMMVAMSGYQEKESNPYTWGGIASGIAGGGAGLYTAMKTEQENAAIRARNANNQQTAIDLSLDIKKAAWSKKDELKEIEAQLDHAQTCLVAETPANEVLDKLKISNVHVEISETGAFTVTAKVKAADSLTIYDNMDAVADGTIIAHLSQDGTEIGTAKLVLPCFGVDHNESIELKGMGGHKGAREGKKSTVTFSANNLWLMEK